jgi:hypothetical protein
MSWIRATLCSSNFRLPILVVTRWDNEKVPQRDHGILVYCEIFPHHGNNVIWLFGYFGSRHKRFSLRF